MSSTPTLLDIGPDAYAHQTQVDEVKRQLGVDHNHFDCWIYGFLENKNFKVDEAVAKLNRREEFEQNELANEEVTDWMVENMKKGIIQVIGSDKAGRVAFYICTARDKPSHSRREESKKNFDMFVSYGTRLRAENKRCQIAMLINQDKASLFSNLDMTFQADIALRIAKYYPGCVDKMYICKMGRTLAALAKPIFSRLPAIVSERIIIISEGDIKHGKLLELFDEDVLPIALGGKNDCDKEENYSRFAYMIKEYSEQLRSAIKRGVSVKEWELSNLRAAGHVHENTALDALRQSMIDPGMSISRGLASEGLDGVELPSMSDANKSWSARSARVNDSGADDVDNEENLATCETVTVEPARRSISSMSRLQVASHTPQTARDLFTDYVSQFAMIEGFFRISVSEMHEREWLQLLQREVEERQDIIRLEDQFHTESLFRALPPTIYLAVKAFLWLSLLVNSFFFFIGTLFIALLGVLTMLYTFFAMFSHTYNVFLYGAAFVVTSVQFTIFCSRGFDLVRNTFNGKLILALKALGNKALIFQVVICVMTTIAYFVVFCVMAVRHDVLTGLEFSLAYGWIVAVCLTIIYHFFFAFGFKEISKTSYRHGSRVNNAEASLYLFMDVDLDDDSSKGRSALEVIALTLVGVLAFAAGLAYMCTQGDGIFFLSATVVLLVLLLFLSSVFMFSSNASSSSSVAFVAVMYACVFWIDAVFTMTMHGWNNGWGGSLLTVLFIMLFFCVTVFVSVYGPWHGSVRRWLFRISWGLVVLHVLGCIIGLYVYNYRMALFVMALTIHLLICCFRTNEASSTYGIFTMSTVFAAALLACCLIGNYSTKELYGSSVSAGLLPAYNSTDYDLTPTVRSEVLPVCLLRFPDQSLSIVGMALFAKLGNDYNEDAQEADLKTWFPNFTRMGSLGSDSKKAKEVIEVTGFRQEASTHNTTIITIRSSRNKQRIIEAITMWIDQYCLSFFSFLMPEQYVYRIMPYITFADRMSPLLWRSSLDTMVSVLQGFVDTLDGENEYVYVVGHGTAGAMGAVAALKTDLPIVVVTFSTPEVLSKRFKLHLSESDMSARMVNVRTTQSVFNSWFYVTPHTEMIPCSKNGGKKCDKLDTTVRTLDSICRSSTSA